MCNLREENMKNKLIRTVISLSSSVVISFAIIFLAVSTVSHLADKLPEPFSSVFTQLSDAVCVPSIPVLAICCGLLFLLSYCLCTKVTVTRVLGAMLYLVFEYAVVFFTLRVNSIPIYTAAEVVVKIMNSGIL